MSEMRSRIAGARLRYVKGIEEGKNELLKKILGETREDERNKEIYRRHRSERNFWRMGKNEVKDKTREMDDKRWQEEIQGKSSIKIYEEEKKEIKN